MVNEGEMVFTPPMIDHGMRFPVDTVFLTLGRNSRDQATYEADVVRVDFVPTEGWTSWQPGDEQHRRHRQVMFKSDHVVPPGITRLVFAFVSPGLAAPGVPCRALRRMSAACQPLGRRARQARRST